MGHGLIGALSARHADDGVAVVAIDLRELDAAQRALCRETFVGDICDAALLDRLASTYEITEIHHLAALLSTRAEAVPEKANAVNVTGTLNLLSLAADEARRNGRSVRFMFPSSIAAYGLPDLGTKNAAPPVHEDEYPEPITMYGCNKLYGEHLGRYYAMHYRQLAENRTDRPIDFRAIRFPGIISSDTVPTGGTSDYAPEMIHAAAAGRPYACFVRPDSRIPFTTMPEAIGAMLALATADESRLTRRVYNIASFSPSAEEIAALVAEHFPGAVTTFEPTLARQRIVDSWPAEVDDSAARRDWSFQPEHTLRSAFEAYLVPRIAARYERG